MLHVSAPNIMNKKQIDWWEKNIGLKMLCHICGKPVDEGGQKDHFWPYFDEMNRCKECLDKERGGINK